MRATSSTKLLRSSPAQCGQRLDASAVALEFQKPIQYQAPQQVCVGLRYSY